MLKLYIFNPEASHQSGLRIMPFAPPFDSGATKRQSKIMRRIYTNHTVKEGVGGVKYLHVYEVLPQIQGAVRDGESTLAPVLDRLLEADSMAAVHYTIDEVVKAPETSEAVPVDDAEIHPKEYWTWFNRQIQLLCIDTATVSFAIIDEDGYPAVVQGWLSLSGGLDALLTAAKAYAERREISGDDMRKILDEERENGEELGLTALDHLEILGIWSGEMKLSWPNFLAALKLMGAVRVTSGTKLNLNLETLPEIYNK
tara:strand:- start:674 stop:1441 length:768 start_codon:yes stop_codon:yes gene_type:complete